MTFACLMYTYVHGWKWVFQPNDACRVYKVISYRISTLNTPVYFATGLCFVLHVKDSSLNNIKVKGINIKVHEVHVSY